MKALAATLLMTVALACSAQERLDPAALMAAQREAMAKLAFMDGVWRGPASTVLPSGEKHDITQTERIGPLLGGIVKVIEGRGYEPDGKTHVQRAGDHFVRRRQARVHDALVRHGIRGRLPGHAHRGRVHVVDSGGADHDPLQRGA